MLSSLGTYWLGEGYGLVWPEADLALFGLMVGFAAVALLGGPILRHRRPLGSVILSA
jgi:uncharacterized membrane protein